MIGHYRGFAREGCSPIRKNCRGVREFRGARARRGCAAAPDSSATLQAMDLAGPPKAICDTGPHCARCHFHFLSMRPESSPTTGSSQGMDAASPSAKSALSRPSDRKATEDGKQAHAPAKQRPLLLIPREHGSWGMLLFPFVSAAILTRNWTWTFIPATLCVLGVFLLREPLVILARQRYVWVNRHPETEDARRSLLTLGIVLGGAGFWLLLAVPLGWLLALGAAAVLLAVIYIYGAIHNLQRSPLLQIVGAAGLTISGVLAYLAGNRLPDESLALLLSAHLIHNAGGVLVVHARIEAARAHRGRQKQETKATAAVIWMIVHALAAGTLAWRGQPALGAALAIPWAVHALDLARLRNPTFLQVPLRRVGFRELALSTAFAIAVLVALW